MDKIKLIKQRLENEVIAVKTPSPRQIFIRVSREKLKIAVQKLVNSKGYSHLLTLTGIDVGRYIEIIYHIIHNGLTVSLKTKVSKKNPVLPTITDLVPGSILYEREVHDLLGVEFEGNPDLSRLLLSDDWPSNVYPLRKNALEGGEDI